MQSKTEAISKYLKEGPSKKYKRPERCIMNEIIFGEDKAKSNWLYYFDIW